MIWRSFCENTYTTCSRCERKVPIAECAWNAGLLVCRTYGCVDTAINGSLELHWAREASRDRRELVPDDKLIHPVDPGSQLEHVSAAAGTYE